ncbi:sugar ABC transporter permease [Paenibacillus cisolokensis]|jgi:simple sugar transport system permease protein/ribose transport system permease protein|uniref:Sugar ABC transporter permease n=1 Tax=Paenibacillus cisolokensis TaxID=1658519 RepID=A0ABQ4NEI8_9BACL|nr:ABC transporter permease [Paenibacillus cisolokensis]GIQ66607.1 sugar ABC transporter permease [Paenibacillus cisolokensis]
MKWLNTKEGGIFLILIALSAVLAVRSPVFLTMENMIDMLKTNVVLAMMAIGMTLVIVIGGIDVSVGAMTALVSVLIGKWMVAFGYDLSVVLLMSVAGGAVLGAINGWLISKIRVHAIVVTLGTLSIYSGIAMYVTGGIWINNLPQAFIDFGRQNLFGIPMSGGTLAIPIQVLFLVLVAAATGYMLKHLRIGRMIYAVGGNPLSAERAGIRQDRVQLFVYTYMGFLSGLAAFVHTSIYRQVDPSAFTGFELQVIAAVVLGGANILGGSGSVTGTLLGVALLAVISNGLTLTHVPSFWHKVIIGLFIVTAVSFDIIQRKRRERRLAKIDVLQ